MQNLIYWLETFWKQYSILFLAFLLMTTSFGVGYLFGKGENPAPIIIEKCSE